ncbi:hypothetical protein NDU88_006108 [Pleurodeles waltl]|uniref:Uncharacterized protein n=1 Tax=Pleurodeles waltl TaxID=8319 RepID=A0AAV7PQH1_PLEWA|nr:hypothetical protein NDU88_006108 [Pleurodeles waltl]
MGTSPLLIRGREAELAWSRKAAGRHRSIGSKAECSTPERERTGSWASHEGAAVWEGSAAAHPFSPGGWAGKIRAPVEEPEKESQRRRGELLCRKVARQHTAEYAPFSLPVGRNRERPGRRRGERGEGRRSYRAGQSVARQCVLLSPRPTAHKDSTCIVDAPGVRRGPWCGEVEVEARNAAQASLLLPLTWGLGELNWAELGRLGQTVEGSHRQQRKRSAGPMEMRQ